MNTVDLVLEDQLGHGRRASQMRNGRPLRENVAELYVWKIVRRGPNGPLRTRECPLIECLLCMKNMLQ